LAPSTIAAVGDESAYLQTFCAELKDPSSEVARLQRKLSRSIRASNPDCFEPDRCDLPKPGQKHGKRKQGKAIKGQRQKQRSNRYRKVQARKAKVERKLAAQRKSLHGELGHKTVAMGRNIKTEKLSYKAFQRMFGRSVGKRAPGGFMARLKQIAENAGESVQEFPTRETKLSQRCVCGRIQKKSLSERIHRCACGVLHQRDLWSAFLARHVDTDNGFQVATALAEADGVDTRLVEAWKQHQPSIVERVLNAVGATPASEKVSREVSLSASVDSLGETAKRLDDVESVQLNRFESQNEAA
jgi:putative transposase